MPPIMSQRNTSNIRASHSSKSVSSKLFCRVCFEERDENISHVNDFNPLISPCSCKGSSLLIHRACLEQWQDLSIRRNLFQYALICPTCHSYYSYPSLLIQVYKISLYYISIRMNNYTKSILSLVWSAFLFIKVIFYLFLTICLLFLNSQIKLFGNYALAALKDNGTLQLAIIHSTGRSTTSTDDNQVITVGMCIKSTYNVPNTSALYNTIILIFEHTTERTRGLVICDHNYDLSHRQHSHGRYTPSLQSHASTSTLHSNVHVTRHMRYVVQYNVVYDTHKGIYVYLITSVIHQYFLYTYTRIYYMCRYSTGGPVNRSKIFALSSSLTHFDIQKAPYIHTIYDRSLKSNIYIGEYDEAYWVYIHDLYDIQPQAPRHGLSTSSSFCTTYTTHTTHMSNSISEPRLGSGQDCGDSTAPGVTLASNTHAVHDDIYHYTYPPDQIDGHNGGHNSDQCTSEVHAIGSLTFSMNEVRLFKGCVAGLPGQLEGEVIHHIWDDSTHLLSRPKMGHLFPSHTPHMGRGG